MRSSYIGPIEVILCPVNRFRTQGVLEGLYSTADRRNPKVALNFDVNKRVRLGLWSIGQEEGHNTYAFFRRVLRFRIRYPMRSSNRTRKSSSP